jgi:predicted enzyme related to lactoylglutathione lyase
VFKKVAFTMYPITDVARARKFYEETFGLDLKSKGVTFKSDVIHSPVCRMAVCLDSEGNSILLHQLKPKGA